MRTVATLLACLLCLVAGHLIGTTSSARDAEMRLAAHLDANRDRLPDIVRLESLKARDLRHATVADKARRAGWGDRAAEEAAKSQLTGHARASTDPQLLTQEANEAWGVQMRALHVWALGASDWDPRLARFTAYSNLRLAALVQHHHHLLTEAQRPRPQLSPAETAHLDRLKGRIAKLGADERGEAWNRQWYAECPDPIRLMDETFAPSLRTLPPEFAAALLTKFDDVLDELEAILVR